MNPAAAVRRQDKEVDGFIVQDAFDVLEDATFAEKRCAGDSLFGNQRLQLIEIGSEVGLYFQQCSREYGGHSFAGGMGHDVNQPQRGVIDLRDVDGAVKGRRSGVREVDGDKDPVGVGEADGDGKYGKWLGSHASTSGMIMLRDWADCQWRRSQWKLPVVRAQFFGGTSETAGLQFERSARGQSYEHEPA